MKAGDKIRCKRYMMGCVVGSNDFTVEEFRYSLGIFESEQHREAGKFTPLCDLYEPSAKSESSYIPNFGSYNTDMIESWENINP